MNKAIYFAFQSAPNRIPTQEELTSFQRKYKKDFKSRELYEGEELLQEFQYRSWKHPRYSKIISFIVAFENEGVMRVRYITGDEKDIIQEFYNILQKSKDYQIVLFDAQITLPFLGIRATRNGFLNTPSNGIKYKGLRPWNLDCVDLQAYYDGAGNYKSSIKDIAEDFDIDCSDVIEIEDEIVYFESGQTEALKKSAIQKVEILAEVWRKLNNLDKLETVIVEEQVKDVVEEKPTDFITELYHCTEMTADIKKGIIEQIRSRNKRVSKKDKENLSEILRGIYVKTDFISGQCDSKETIKKKEEEIRMLLDEI